MSTHQQLDQLPEALFKHHRGEGEFDFDKTMPLGILIPRQLGRACLMRLNGEKSKANRTVKSARSGAQRLAKQRPKPSIFRRFSIEAMAKHYGDYVIHADNVTGLLKGREQQHQLEFKQLNHSLRAINNAPNEYREGLWAGQINELTTLALLNRNASSDMAGLPALLHHDQGAVDGMNYDVLALLSDGAESEATPYKLQVKSSASQARSAKSKFQDDIVIICAEDLFSYKPRTEGVSPKFPMAHFLLAERRGGSEALTEELDNVTTALRQTILEQTVTIEPVAS